MRKLNVKLLYIANCNVEDESLDSNIRFPIGLHSLKKYAESRVPDNVEITIHTFYKATPISTIIKSISPSPDDLIGISCFIWNIGKSLSLGKRIKDRYNCKIIAGGPHTIAAKDLMTENPFIDICVRGEGEDVFVSILNALANGTPPPAQAGLIVRDGNEIIDHGGNGMISDINTLPEIFSSDMIRSLPSGQPILYFTELGCFGNCKYCTQTPNLRRMDLKRVENELRTILTAENTGELGLIDTDMSFDLKRTKQILRMIIKYNVKNVAVRIFFGFLNIDDEIIEILNHGEFYIMIGIQSLDRNTVIDMNRSLYVRRRSTDSLVAALGRLDKRKMNVNFIYGLPGDTYETFGDNLRWIQGIGVYYGVFQLLLLPGTQLRIHAAKYGIRYRNKPYYNVIHTDSFPRKDILKARSSIFWTYALSTIMQIHEAQALAQQGILLWDIVQHFPMLTTKQLKVYCDGTDTGCMVLKNEKNDGLRAWLRQLISDLAATDSHAAALLPFCNRV